MSPAPAVLTIYFSLWVPVLSTPRGTRHAASAALSRRRRGGMSRPLQIPVQEKSKRFPSLNMNASFNPAGGRGGARAAPAGALSLPSPCEAYRAHARRLFAAQLPGGSVRRYRVVAAGAIKNPPHPPRRVLLGCVSSRLLLSCEGAGVGS